jgi:hypothetical protein
VSNKPGVGALRAAANPVCGNQRVNRMTDSAVLDTILGLLFLFYALALLCGGLVEMIAN